MMKKNGRGTGDEEGKGKSWVVQKFISRTFFLEQ
jgi:hypothetical protein